MQLYPEEHVPQLPPHPLLPHCLLTQFAVLGSVATQEPYEPLEHVRVPVTEQVPNVDEQLMLLAPQFNVPPHPSLHEPHSFPNSEQVLGVHDGGDGHVPQSIEQLEHDSPDSQILFPHTGGQEPQSAGHVEQFSAPLQIASPQNIPDPIE